MYLKVFLSSEYKCSRSKSMELFIARHVYLRNQCVSRSDSNSSTVTTAPGTYQLHWASTSVNLPTPIVCLCAATRQYPIPLPINASSTYNYINFCPIASTINWKINLSLPKPLHQYQYPPSQDNTSNTNLIST